jgi:hypothetical protein
MKKLYIIIMLGIIGLSANAQRFYADAGLGWGFNAASSSFGENISNTPLNYSLVKGSLGKGFPFGLKFGFMFNENISAELGIGYFIGSEITMTSTRDPQTYYYSVETSSYKASMVRVMPGVKLTSGNKIKPYAKFGFAIGIFGNIIFNNDATGALIVSQTYKYSGNLAMGYYGAFGIEYHLTDKISLFAEVMSINQSWAPGHSIITKYNMNGINQLASMPTSQKEIDYVNTITSADTTRNGNIPSKELKQYYPMSSLAINVGIHFTFGKVMTYPETPEKH